MKNENLYHESNEATYCPEDDKLRLYVGRVPREEYLALKKEGWTSTPKQSCDFVAVWSIRREDTALSYAGEIGDEDQSPEERAADRAARFAGYRDKRRAEAGEYADRFVQPTVHGYQSQERAERAAARHARIGVKACSQWDKAEYWQQRTAGVISHALYRSRPSVRMGRIKEIESDMRRAIAAYTPASDAPRSMDTPYYCPVCDKSNCEEHPEAKVAIEMVYCGRSHGWKKVTDLPMIKERYARFIRHCELRLQYENAMLDAVGGMAGELEIEVGGRFAGKLITKVNKSSVTGRVTSVEVATKKDPRPWLTRETIPEWFFVSYNVEKSTSEAYIPPTEEDKALVKQIKAATKKKNTAPPLINPKMESATELQNIINKKEATALLKRNNMTEPVAPNDRPWYTKVVEQYHAIMNTKPINSTQSAYSSQSSGAYSRCETKGYAADGTRPRKQYRGHILEGCAFRVRVLNGGMETPDRVIVITDKPQKALPLQVAEEVTA